MSKTIAVIRGDGIGPEIMDATLRVLDALDCGLSYETSTPAWSRWKSTANCCRKATLDKIAEHKIALKGPLTTPIGGGFTSINVTLRRHFDLYANVRPAISFPGHQVALRRTSTSSRCARTPRAPTWPKARRCPADGETADSIIRNTRKGSSRIVRYAFELAVKKGRKKVTAVHKANIIKTSSGLFLNVAREIAKEYPQIEFNEMIVDNTCMQLVMRPEQFDVIVTTNLFGDILSDLCAGLVGGLGLAPGDNIGENAAIFEAVHGSAPDIAGKGIANPCALLLAAADMLDHLGMVEKGSKLRQAIRDTMETRPRPGHAGSGWQGQHRELRRGDREARQGLIMRRHGNERPRHGRGLFVRARQAGHRLGCAAFATAPASRCSSPSGSSSTSPPPCRPALLGLALWRRVVNREANRVLAVWVALTGVDLAVKAMFWHLLTPEWFRAYRFVALFPFLYGSLFYLYVRALMVVAGSVRAMSCTWPVSA